MGLVDSIKNFFVGDTTTTMNMGRGLEVLRTPTNDIADFYDNFQYPYSPMQRTKRYPKIINAYALQERARADVRGFINHKSLIDGLTQRVATLETLEQSSRIEASKQISTSQNVANGASTAFEQTFLLYNNDSVVGVSQVYFNSNNYEQANADFRLCGFSYTVEPYDDDRKRVRWRVAGTNQTGAQRNNVTAVVTFHIYRSIIV